MQIDGVRIIIKTSLSAVIHSFTFLIDLKFVEDD